jgi:hypothetical protein
MSDSATTNTRQASLSKALAWYTSAPQSLTITPIHYPTPDKPTPEDPEPRGGRCSCGGRYTVDENGVLVKPDSGDNIAEMCLSPGKHPLRAQYVRDPGNQADSPERATELWGGQLWNIGIVHGQTTGLVVLDVDVRAGGLASMTKLTEALAEVAPEWALADTLTYLTSGKSGRGYHMYFRADRDDVDLWRSFRAMGETVLPGVEVKWKSGMVVAAPSLHASGQVYELRSTLPLQSIDRPRLEQLRAAIARANGKAAPVPSGPVSASGGWAAMAQRAEDYASRTGSAFGGELSWESAREDSEDNPGYWSRQLSYFLMTGQPAQKFGAGNHHDPLKSLVGALAKIIFAKDSFCQEVATTAAARSKDQFWIPAVFGSLVWDIDAAVTVPKPWQFTDPQNLRGIARYSMVQELRAHGVRNLI